LNNNTERFVHFYFSKSRITSVQCCNRSSFSSKIVSEFCVLVAALHVLRAQAEDCMYTSDIHSELILTLAANKNVSFSQSATY
jgi:hypothetical protein